MPVRLDATSTGFERDFAALLAKKREVSADVDNAVREIVADVRARGDVAVLEKTNRFDRRNAAAMAELLLDEAALEEALNTIPAHQREALEIAARRIRVFHERQKPSDTRFTDELGVELGWRWSAVGSAGLYVPGGTAAYPSSVLMNAIPAHVAGVERLVMVVPAPEGKLNPLVLAAARLGGVKEVWTIGGAQAVAALAYGTQSIKPVAKIVGPGNAYVAAAKRQVFGQVGIDMIAGPSEVLIVADGSANPDWIAADLLAQAEHDTSAQSILITDSAALADKVAASVERQLANLPRRDIAGPSWADYGAIIVMQDLRDAVPLCDRIAAEHLELMGPKAEALVDLVRDAGAIFLGQETPEAIGDYVGGSNHVLPTARSARFSSGLGVLDFMKRTSLLRVPPRGLAVLGPAAITLAEAEGLDAHARSVAIRMGQTF